MMKARIDECICAGFTDTRTNGLFRSEHGGRKRLLMAGAGAGE